MSIRTSRPLLALCLSVIMLVGFVVPAGATGLSEPAAVAPNLTGWSGYTQCASDEDLRVYSSANGWVDHFVNGNLAGFWYNGPTFELRFSTTSADGSWQVSTSGFLDYAGAFCVEGSPPPQPPPENLAPSVSGFESCPGSTVSIRSEAKGNVGHSVYGQTQGTWNNGSTFRVNTSHTSFTSGSWMAWSDDNEGVRVDHSYAFCY